MAEKIDFYQIWFKEDHKAKLYPFATPYFNEGLTPYFENTIISELVSQSEADKIAVCSWALRDKRTGVIPPKRDVSIEVMQEDFDVMSFTKNGRDHDMLGALDAWHPGSSAILRKIFKKLGHKMVERPNFPIYQNAFCAKTDIYKRYVEEFLNPAMLLIHFDEEIHHLAFQNSNYTRTITNIPVDLVRIKRLLGLDYYPLVPFLLERCFSLWIEDKNYKIVYL